MRLDHRDNAERTYVEVVLSCEIAKAEVSFVTLPLYTASEVNALWST